jgi:hydrogenase/urease accessory protein HupE
MSYKEAFLKANIQGIIALIIIIGGLYILYLDESGNDVKMAVVGLMSMVVGYYFGSSTPKIKHDETLNTK